ncbi:neuroblast differentiation-associated protein AHNAK isoform X23 [Sapajus apella]|uniref:Neuroblast differentiation-associated protein AHNAK isoform X23 n=1 Tax=Sapajus apella TaxID=9515 RepID=A0A6J3IAM0_SAPAP|nr:neuroblast differentiation-associated protein AHNAK isoform X23 [Sapajus apella]
MEKEEETTRELLLPNWQGSGSHGLTIAQRDDGVFVQEVMQNSPAARTGVVKEGDQIVGATIYFDNLQSDEVTQLLNTMGHHTVGLKLHRKGDRSPEPGQTWTHEVFSSRSSEVVLNTPQPSALECKDRNKQKEATSQAGAVSVSTPNAALRETHRTCTYYRRIPDSFRRNLKGFFIGRAAAEYPRAFKTVPIKPRSQGGAETKDRIKGLESTPSGRSTRA